MKRCPQCLFLYPDSDERCDFDQTRLEVVDDDAVEAATNTSKPRVRRQSRVIVIAAAGLIFAVLAVALYFTMGRRTQRAVAAPAAPLSTPAPIASPQAMLPEPSPSPSVSPSPSPSPTAKVTSDKVATAHTRTSLDPVSTSGPGIGTRQGSKPVITLTSGGKIDADEVWRTKDGVWYRRNGIVTLLKRNQVKAIVAR